VTGCSRAPAGSLITVICICLFIGAMGKSAQFPLHVWLPDSMEGPTPISALIHAATMVTAGIFMVARMSPLFELSDTALNFVLVIGAITALFMGFLGIIQNDIKRVVAYSTLSQLGYMTVALGASAYSVAVFHLMTHAFFKALLFLGAGSVIIGMHHDQDIRNMGGLRKYMPITWITSLLGSLALIGTPFFSGFYSKDSIIEAVHSSHLPAAGFAYFAVLAGRVRDRVLLVPDVLPGLPRRPGATSTTWTGSTKTSSLAAPVPLAQAFGRAVMPRSSTGFWSMVPGRSSDGFLARCAGSRRAICTTMRLP
jgi:NADH:ubiquinone oxidoreductase subunit 5 (subunit L)/multisubunit Na+/H+ antiporter MnhA subunit